MAIAHIAALVVTLAGATLDVEALAGRVVPWVAGRIAATIARRRRRACAYRSQAMPERYRSLPLRRNRGRASPG